MRSTLACVLVLAALATAAGQAAEPPSDTTIPGWNPHKAACGALTKAEVVNAIGRPIAHRSGGSDGDFAIGPIDREVADAFELANTSVCQWAASAGKPVLSLLIVPAREQATLERLLVLTRSKRSACRHFPSLGADACGARGGSALWSVKGRLAIYTFINKRPLSTVRKTIRRDEALQKVEAALVRKLFARIDLG